MTTTATRTSAKWTNYKGTHVTSLGQLGDPGAVDVVVAGDPVAGYTFTVTDANTAEEIAANIPDVRLETWQDARKAALAAARTLAEELAR